MYTLGARGISVPKDVEVVGFDGIEEGKFSIPSFSTISPGVNDASELILNILTEPEDLGWGHHPVPFSLVSR
jgi:DNA-binding LacI/PurR family transcriptional regulator